MSAEIIQAPGRDLFCSLFHPVESFPTPQTSYICIVEMILLVRRLPRLDIEIEALKK